MIKFFKRNFELFFLFIIPFAIFFPSLFVFYTNDDFYFLNISHVGNLAGLLNFLSFTKSPVGFGIYPYLTSQVFYYLSWKFFNLNPLGLHIISFLTFFLLIFLVYKLVFILVGNSKIAYISALLYGVSATHFAHLYYLAVFQELGMTVFVLLTCLMFIKKKYLPAFIVFLLALMSKETAVITPVLLILIYFFEKYSGRKVVNFKKILVLVLPYLLTLAVYLLLRFRFYGFATGDSYVWDFSIKKLANTLFWYLLWSLNLPESLVDFIGPGIKVNANLFIYWSKQIIPILVLFFAEGIILVAALLKAVYIKNQRMRKDGSLLSLFCILWFLVTIAPVAFLPLHKFSFYLTLPLFALTLRISYLLEKSKLGNLFIGAFVIVWIVMSVLTVNYSRSTSWITQGEAVSKRAFDYFAANLAKIDGKNVYFSDTFSDLTLPWSPTSVVQTVLSGQNFFKVFYPSLADRVNYVSGGKVPQGSYIIKSRDLLGY